MFVICFFVFFSTRVKVFNLTTGCFNLSGSLHIKDLSTSDCLFIERQKHKLRDKDQRDLNKASVPKGRKDLRVQPVTAYYLGAAFPKHAWLKQIFILQERRVLMCPLNISVQNGF